MYISDGRTVKDACFFVGISDMTLARWRKRYPDFDEEYLKAVESLQKKEPKSSWSLFVMATPLLMPVVELISHGAHFTSGSASIQTSIRQCARRQTYSGNMLRN